MTEQQTSDSRRVLFIEDDTAVRDAVSRLLQAEGFRVETASDALAGIQLARCRRHDAMLLDLVLPDTPGLVLLSQLRREGIFLPCVVLTGFPGSRSGFEAGRLGALSYLEKPATAAELIAALRSATEAGSSIKPTELFAPRPVTCSQTNILMTELEDLVHRTGANMGEGEEALRVELARPVARAASSPVVTLSQFVAIGYALRAVIEADNAGSVPAALASIRVSFAKAAAYDAVPTRPEVDKIITALGAAGRNVRTLRQDELASALHLQVTRLSQLLDEEFGLSYSDCRLAVIMRRVTCELVHGSEHVRQICFHVGYEDHGNFDRAFRNFFGVTPTKFRSLLR